MRSKRSSGVIALISKRNKNRLLLPGTAIIAFKFRFMSLRNQRLLYGLTIGSSSVLLFSVQPVMAKAILPRFGGTTGVWVTSMLFFQVVLLAGYLYAYLVTRHFNRKAQASLHVALLILSLAWLPLSLRAAGAAD